MGGANHSCHVGLVKEEQVWAQLKNLVIGQQHDESMVKVY